MNSKISKLKNLKASASKQMSEITSKLKNLEASELESLTLEDLKAMSFEDVAWLYTHTSLSFIKSQGDEFSNLETNEAFQLIAYKFLEWAVFNDFSSWGDKDCYGAIENWFYLNQRSDISDLLLLMDHKRGHRVGLKTIRQFCHDKDITFNELQGKYSVKHSAYWLESLDDFIDLLAFYETKDADYIHSLPTEGWTIDNKLVPMLDEDGEQCGYNFEGFIPKHFSDLYIGYWEEYQADRYVKVGGDITYFTHGYAHYSFHTLSGYYALYIKTNNLLLLPSIEGLKKSWVEWVLTSELECLEAIKFLELEQTKQFEDLC